ncbi:MAG: cellulose biosynthesis cyclic di-GMP-binding regulatory protein BcsB [Vampirovibrionales bacterium]|nr:cellulose biosynthesis cyclic di-GMP-binding regulatory protein BcsB [Vampirovibrionales bacterium]
MFLDTSRVLYRFRFLNTIAVKKSLRKIFSAMALLGLFCQALLITTAMAATEQVKLKQLRVKDVIYLPTVNSQRVLQFSKPKTWNLSGSSRIEVTFQHSWELDPSRSRLEVIVNNRLLKQVSLGPDNAKNTTISVPLPVGILKDQNTLTFRVEQHYKAKCEDPLDPSLWTQILPESKLVFDYTPTLPTVDLAGYPFPIIDPLTYSPQPLKFVLPNTPDEKELQALGYINMNLAQSAGRKEVRTSIAHPGNAVDGKDHLIYIGTPSDNSAIAAYQGMISQHPVSGDSGLVLFFQHPTYHDRGVLIATGNTTEGVLQAAKYVSTHPTQADMKGNAVVVPESWNPNSGDSNQAAPFVENQNRSFQQLGYGEESVEKIFAPPINYQVPVLADFLNSNAKLWLDLSYSYGRKGGDLINPKFSSLELRFNDMPIANIPLLQSENGESMAKAAIPIPKDLIQPNNTLVAQYHLLPDKFGYCKGGYEDKAWGKIHDDSTFRVDGVPASLLPNVGVLNYTGFPYSRDANYKNTHFMLPKTPGDGALEAFLGITSRLGRATFSDTDLRFTLSTGDSVPYQTKDLIIIQDLRQPMKLPEGGKLSWNGASPLLKEYMTKYETGSETHKLISYESGDGTYLEQYHPGTSGDRVVTVLAAMHDQGFNNLALMFEDDDRFAKLTPGPMKLLNNSSGDMNTVEATPARVEKTGSGAPGNWWDGILSWFGALFSGLSWPLIIGAAIVLAILLILLPLILRRANQRY